MTFHMARIVHESLEDGLLTQVKLGYLICLFLKLQEGKGTPNTFGPTRTASRSPWTTDSAQEFSYDIKNNIWNLAPFLTTKTNIFRFLLHVCLVPSHAFSVK